MLGAICFFAGVTVGEFHAFWTMLKGDGSQSNPAAKPRIVQHGASQLRDHSELDTIKPSPEFATLADEYAPALDALRDKKSKPSQRAKREQT